MVETTFLKLKVPNLRGNMARLVKWDCSRWFLYSDAFMSVQSAVS